MSAYTHPHPHPHLELDFLDLRTIRPETSIINDGFTASELWAAKLVITPPPLQHHHHPHFPSSSLSAVVNDLPLSSLDTKKSRDPSTPFPRLSELPPPSKTTNPSPPHRFAVVYDCTTCVITCSPLPDPFTLFTPAKYSTKLHSILQLCPAQQLFPPPQTSLLHLTASIIVSSDPSILNLHHHATHIPNLRASYRHHLLSCPHPSSTRIWHPDPCLSSTLLPLLVNKFIFPSLTLAETLLTIRAPSIYRPGFVLFLAEKIHAKLSSRQWSDLSYADVGDYILSAMSAINIVLHTNINSAGAKTSEELARQVHDAWLLRYESRYGKRQTALLDCDYEDLPEVEKEKDFVVLEICREFVDVDVDVDLDVCERNGKTERDDDGESTTTTRSLAVVDLGCGAGRDVAYLAEELQFFSSASSSTFPKTKVKIFGLDYHPGCSKRCVPLWERRGLTDVTQHVMIDLKNLPQFDEFVNGVEEKIVMFFSVRYINRALFKHLAEKILEAGAIFSVSHFVQEEDGTYPHDTPKIVDVVARSNQFPDSKNELRAIFPPSTFALLSEHYRREEDKGRLLVEFVVQKTLT